MSLETMAASRRVGQVADMGVHPAICTFAVGFVSGIAWSLSILLFQDAGAGSTPP